jgi:hypothetical protein
MIEILLNFIDFFIYLGAFVSLIILSKIIIDFINGK